MATETLKELAMQSAIIPKESPFAIRKDDKILSLGLPKELSAFENRIALTPDAVALLIKNNMQVAVETGAGLSANYTDNEYANAGARIIYGHKEIFENDIILKIDPLTLSLIHI